MTASTKCYHCGTKISDADPKILASVGEEIHQVCCHGCKAITEHIIGSGLSSYYQFRSDLASRPESDVDVSQFDVYSDQKLLHLVAEPITNSQTYKIILSVENIHCAACAWLIEQSLSSASGVEKITVNTVNQRAELIWDNSQIDLSSLLSQFAEIGYPSAPFKVSDTEESIKKQNKKFITRLGVAGLFTMQVMMIAFAMYFGAFEQMESHQAGYFKWLSMLLSVPVIFYSALPFFFGSYYALKARKLNMDVPVAAAIYGAFFASFYQLLDHGLDGHKGEVFFESICMFTFLLLIGKYLEFKAKSKAILSNANLNKTIPITVNRLTNGEQQKVLVQDLKLGEMVLVKPGESLAIDGIIQKGATSVNESVLNGEFTPVSKSVGQNVFAGSVNNDGVIEVEITALGDETTLANISKLQSEFSTHKPKFTEFADKIAHWFVLSQLILAMITFGVWYFYSPQDALWVSLSVLVATCPCSLSLATPTAYTCVMSALNRKGILIKDPKAFDKLNHITHVAFDKTGTLTFGKFSILESSYFDNGNSKNTHSTKIDSTTLNAAIVKLQSYSEHPIAKAFNVSSLKVNEAPLQSVELTDIQVHVGQGLSARLEQQELKIGKAEFTEVELESSRSQNNNVFVTLDGKLMASFYVADEIKDEAHECINQLSNANRQSVMLTGDSSNHGELLAQQLGLNDVKVGCTPEQKAQYVQSIQNSDEETTQRVLMVGDGINDAPVFAASDISVAMASGADITKQSADILVLRNNLNAINELFVAASETRKIVRQNLLWSLIYNAVILPVAMLGFVAPYIAVIGMSASSILVVTRSLKLLKL